MPQFSSAIWLSVALTFALPTASKVLAQETGKPLFEMPASGSKSDLLLKGLGGIISTIPALQEAGLKARIEKHFATLAPRLMSDLVYSGNGGVLFKVKIQSYSVPAGRHVDLVGDELQYIGIGSSPADAELASISRGPYLEESLKKDWVLDADSTAYWLTRDAKGNVKLLHSPLSQLTIETLTLYSKRVFDKFDWERARYDEMLRLIDIAKRRVEKTEVRGQVKTLEDNMRSALEKQIAINMKLEEELKRAAQATQNAAALQAVGDTLSAASSMAVATNKLSPADAKAISKTPLAQVPAKLIEIRDVSTGEANLIRRNVETQTMVIKGYDVEIGKWLEVRRAPNTNIPSGKKPVGLGK